MGVAWKIWIILKLIAWHVIFWASPTTEEAFYSHKGYCHMQLGNYEKALSNYRRALKDSPGPSMRSWLHSAMGYCYSQLGLEDQSATYYEKAHPKSTLIDSFAHQYRSGTGKAPSKGKEKLLEKVILDAEKEYRGKEK